jgi:hypothetical protein
VLAVGRLGAEDEITERHLEERLGGFESPARGRGLGGG